MFSRVCSSFGMGSESEISYS
uniref:Uncharacterized protein n=1 Tax=Arundo donax TaxID=35708 RepID=A0A0A9EY31_ARUDO